MRKYLALFALVVVCQAVYSQKSVDQLVNEFAKMKETQSVKMGKVFMSFAGMFTDTMGVDSIEAYSFNDCSSAEKERLTKALRSLNDSKFETMVTSNEGKNRTKVLVRIEEEMIREMVVISTGASNALVRIKGKIKPSDIEQVMEKHGKGGC